MKILNALHKHTWFDIIIIAIIECIYSQMVWYNKLHLQQNRIFNHEQPV